MNETTIGKRSRRMRSATERANRVALFERSGDRSAGVTQNVPQEEDEDSCRERVQKTLNCLGNATHARHRKAKENRGPCNGAQSHCGGLAHMVIVC